MSHDDLSSAVIILETLVEQVGVCGFAGAGQGVTTRNGRSIPRSYNTAMCPQNRAIQLVAAPTKWVNAYIVTK